VRDQVSHPYETTGTIINVLFFMFLDIYLTSTGLYSISCRIRRFKIHILGTVEVKYE
jgi:hypothetical protein